MAEEYQVTMSYNNETNVTLESATNTQVSTSYIVAESLDDLGNVDTSALDKTGTTTDNYVLVYDAAAQKYKFVNPDAVFLQLLTALKQFNQDCHKTLSILSTPTWIT